MILFENQYLHKEKSVIDKEKQAKKENYDFSY